MLIGSKQHPVLTVSIDIKDGGILEILLTWSLLGVIVKMLGGDGVSNSNMAHSLSK